MASIIGAARNGVAGMGVADRSTLLVLRSEMSGSCPDCTFADSTVAHAIDLTVADKARVINLSMGSDTTSPEVVTEIRNAAKARCSPNKDGPRATTGRGHRSLPCVRWEPSAGSAGCSSTPR